MSKEIKHELSHEINIRRLKPIDVGYESPKYIAEVVDASSSEPYTMFVKSMYDRKDALRQQRRWHDLKMLGVNVPETAWAHKFENGTQALVVTDLSENGNKFVLSCNNPELKTLGVRTAIRSMPSETKQTIRDHLILSSVAVAGLGSVHIERRYSLSNNTFALVIDIQHPENAIPVAIDYGIDLHEHMLNETRQDLLRISLIGVGCFYAVVVGEELELPDSPVFTSIDRVALKNYCQEVLEFSWNEGLRE